jgi:hypothetical protein
MLLHTDCPAHRDQWGVAEALEQAIFVTISPLRRVEDLSLAAAGRPYALVCRSGSTQPRTNIMPFLFAMVIYSCATCSMPCKWPAGLGTQMMSYRRDAHKNASTAALTTPEQASLRRDRHGTVVTSSLCCMRGVNVWWYRDQFFVS